ncbi:uncharacterized protein LOC129716738 [Wyeomyia smithii]|uniref:uncharacterized protein LOC129716738 n=1 Tax=Wyeomyia smithii TaxID=174621 RepID=UPI002467C994|nr:uncharacterized protein LOC129716738 [Wyeomyia smithii]
MVDSSIKLVAYHHLPLSCFEWEGLRQVFDPLEAALGMKMNRPNAKGHINQAVAKMIPMMASGMNNRLLCLMIDSATRLNHHVLGIGVQYTVDGKFVTRTIDLASSWEFIQQYVEAFKPCFICTKKLQEAHVPLEDFYMEWLMTICSVRKLGSNPFARDLTEALTNRLSKLHDSMALYLDPRFNYPNSNIFTNEERCQIQRFIIRTWDDFITEMFGGSLNGSNISSTTFQQQLKTLEAEQRQNTNYDVWEHWMNRKTSHPEL